MGKAFGSKEELAESDEGSLSLRRSLGVGAKEKEAKGGYGPRRNKWPKCWELYPEEIEECAEEMEAEGRRGRATSVSTPASPTKGGHQNGNGNGYASIPPASPSTSLTSIRHGLARSSTSSQPRPPPSRENSFDRGSIIRGRSSMDTNGSAPAVGLGLKRVGSLGSANGGSPKSPLGRNGSQEGGLSRVFTNGAEGGSPTISPTQKMGRSGLGRRLDRITGRGKRDGATTGTGTDGDVGSDWRESHHGKSPATSDAEVGGGVGVGRGSGSTRRPSHVRVLSGLSGMSDGAPSGRSKLRKGSSGRISEGWHNDGYKSSGGEGGRRKIWSALSGLKREKDVAECEMVEEVMRGKRTWIDESDEEEEKKVREVVDLNDDDFVRLNS